MKNNHMQSFINRCSKFIIFLNKYSTSIILGIFLSSVDIPSAYFVMPKKLQFVTSIILAHFILSGIDKLVKKVYKPHFFTSDTPSLPAAQDTSHFYFDPKKQRIFINPKVYELVHDIEISIIRIAALFLIAGFLLSILTLRYLGDLMSFQFTLQSSLEKAGPVFAFYYLTVTFAAVTLGALIEQKSSRIGLVFLSFCTFALLLAFIIVILSRIYKADILGMY